MTIDELTALCLARGGTVTMARPPAVPTEPPPARKPRKFKPPLTAAEFVPPATWTVPVYVVAGDNQRGSKSRIGRSGHERRAVHRCLARQYAALTPFVEAMDAGRTVCVTLTRLGPRKMDSDNLHGSLKYIRDAIAERFGIDDGDSRFDWMYAQDIRPAYGVRIEIKEAL